MPKKNSGNQSGQTQWDRVLRQTDDEISRQASEDKNAPVLANQVYHKPAKSLDRAKPRK